MAKIKQGILGGFSGKVASVIGSSWKGIATMRSRPLSVANPKTAGQVGQRTKFSTIVAIAQALLVSTVKPLWDRFAQQMSGFNHFVQQNIDAVSTAGFVTFTSLRLSIGSLTGSENAVVQVVGDNTVLRFTWDDNSGIGSALASDGAFIAAYSEEKDEWVASSADVRSDGASDLQFSGDISADTLHGYIAFRRPDGTIVSNSTYETTIPA